MSFEFTQAAIPPSRSSVASGRSFIEVLKRSFEGNIAIQTAVDTETDAVALRKALRRDAARAGLGLDTEIRPPAEGDESGRFMVVFQARPVREKRSNGVKPVEEDGSPDAAEVA